MHCKRIDRCGFYRKFKNRNHLMWKSIVLDYCVEGNQECVRLMMQNNGDNIISENLLPMGVHATKYHLSLY